MAIPVHKGNRGEMEARKVLEAMGLQIHRTGYEGKFQGASDLVLVEDGELKRVDFEVKRTESFRINQYLAQATAAANRSGGIPRILWRRNQADWVSIGWLKDDQDYARAILKGEG